ncbi:MAG TPA: phosphatidylglycerophosphatase A [Rhizomicrobium sp.]|nr:phosphatidylglycerophosphatase A [Rhizomicrobium sp.]
MTASSSTPPPGAPQAPPQAPPQDWPRTIATVFGIGFTRVAPGTVASIAALPIAWLVVALAGRWWLLVLAVLVAALGAWACELYSRAKMDPDPSECVVDEVAGQLLVCAFCPAPPAIVPYLIAFVLFRAFDITKLWPVSEAEKRIPGGLGIMADDIVAAAMASVIIAILAHLGIV